MNLRQMYTNMAEIHKYHTAKTSETFMGRKCQVGSFDLIDRSTAQSHALNEDTSPPPKER